MQDPQTWKKLCLSEKDPISCAIEIIDQNVNYQIALIVDEDDKIKGTITDGDFRRGALRKVPIEAPVSEIMCRTPITVSYRSSKIEQNEIMRRRMLRNIILVNDDGQIMGLSTLAETRLPSKNENKVCVMAGGLGSRLQSLTKDTPKPLLKVGDTPILEIIVQNFVRQGFQDFYLAVNYKGDQIKEYFGDGSAFGCHIQYINEEMRMGTAGALSLINDKIEAPMIVKNGDLLTRVDFNHFIEFHNTCGASATMAIREHHVEVPFGVVDIDGHTLLGITEKPKKKYFVNAGMYILSPEIIASIPKNVYFDMPSLFEHMAANGQEPAAFPIREYWIDIGQPQHLQQARDEYHEQFIAGKAS